MSIEKIIQESQNISQRNYNNRIFLKDSIYNNEDKLLCSKCENQSSNNYVHKYYKEIRCKDCIKQIEQPI
jgi:late competence protein required for DNA uptake (superfamily II DNA/RNA helicase)